MKNFLLIISGLILFIGLNSVFTVDERYFGLVFQFGQMVRVEKEPGLKFKIPFVQNVSYLDKRILDFSAPEKEVIAKDQKRLIVSAFAKYKVEDPLKFYQTVTNETGARSRLNSILDSSLRQILGEVPLSQLLTMNRSTIMDRIQKIFSEKSKRFGIDVVDVRIMRADLPTENSQAIYKRMQTDREKEAKEIRAEGNEQSDFITSQANKDKVVIIAEATKKSNILKGQGDAIAAKTYGNVFSQDPKFFIFLRSMEAYKKSFSKENTKMIISPESDFLKFFDKSN